MMTSNRRALFVPLLLLLLPAACADAGDPAVWFVEPAQGSEVVGPDVMVRLGASGIRIAPADVQDAGTGHHHIFVNVDVTPLADTIPAGVPGILHLGQGQTEFLVRDLDPGEHRLIAVIAEWNHIPLAPAAMDTVRFTVLAAEEEEEGAEGEEDGEGDG